MCFRSNWSNMIQFLVRLNHVLPIDNVYSEHICIYTYETECDEYIRIFEYSNILVTNIYSDIHSYQFFFYEYIRTFVRVKFVCTNIFGHSLVSVLECKTKTNIRIYSNIRAFFNTNNYSDIRSCQKINMNIFGYSFV